MPVYLPAIGADYLTVKLLSKAKSQLALAYGCGANYGYQTIHIADGIL